MNERRIHSEFIEFLIYLYIVVQESQSEKSQVGGIHKSLSLKIYLHLGNIGV